jgi:hypothetical protein
MKTLLRALGMAPEDAIPIAMQPTSADCRSVEGLVDPAAAEEQQ